MDVTVIWDDEPGGNVEHVAENGLTPDEVDEVLLDDSIPTAHSKATGRASSGTRPPASTSSSSGTNSAMTRA